MKSIFIAIFSLSLIILVGCSNNQQTPEQYTQYLFNQLKSGNFEHLNLDNELVLALENEENDTLSYVLKDAISNLEYNIITSSTESNSATVTTEIIVANLEYAFELTVIASLEEIFLSILNEGLYIEDIDENMVDTLFLETYRSGEAGTISTIVNINLVKENGSWNLSNYNYDLINALTGNLYAVFSDMSDFIDLLDENVEVNQEIEAN